MPKGSRLVTMAALAAASITVAGVAPATAATPKPVIRVGGPSAPSESKVAIVTGGRQLARHRFTVRDEAGEVVLRGRLRRAAGRSAPWSRAYRADLSAVAEAGSYRVEVGRRGSRPWIVRDDGSRPALNTILEFFAANRDGREASPIHGPAHLNDAVIHPDAPIRAGERIPIAGGWMDAGDTLHFTQTTAFATAMLEAAARLDPADPAALESEADVGIRWLRAAHPSPGVFISQVGDERDHRHGFRDPASDDASTLPGIGTRSAYVSVGGDLAGKAAAALAIASVRTGNPDQLAAAKQWYAAGLAAAAPAPRLERAGYPDYAGDFYRARNWKDSMAAGAAELFRASCAAGACDGAYQEDFKRLLSDQRQTGAYAAMGAVDDFASFAAAEVCGAFGAPAPFDDEARALACERLSENGRIAVRQARRNAFAMPGYFTWGTTAQNGAAGALAALATATPDGLADGCATAAGARDYLLGRNPFGASFVIGFGPRAPRHPHHWASLQGPGLPRGAVVGGPAPRDEAADQGFDIGGRLSTARAAYEDRRADYVTSEPAIDYAAASVLLLAALEAHC